VIEIGQHASGVVLRVRAQPRARLARVVGEHGGALKVAVTEPPERGKANAAIAELLAGALELKRGQITLLAGDSSKEKRFLLAGVDPERLRARLARFSAES